jgi:two-component system response regulator HydG
MAQTAFVLILASEMDKGQDLDDTLRERFGHSCRIVTTLEDALDSIRARVPDVVVAIDSAGGQPTVQPLVDLLERVAPDATLLAVGDDGPPPKPRINRIQFLGLRNPADDAELVGPIGQAATRAVARREDRLLRQQLDAHRPEAFEGIIGSSPQIRRIVERIKKAARNKLTVLILGETGTGKELIAQAVHAQSDRAKKPFQWLNCAGLSETLIESELFGHVKGAFTGAVSDRKGHFAAADGGTLFLDEIGDMPIPMQAKLLRVLEHREFAPVGSTEVRRVDVRVVAATNTNLPQRISEREFREDLYYRLNQWRIEVPPLRERRQDIPLLAAHFLRLLGNEGELQVEGISSEAMKLLGAYHWPGNVRQLNHVVTSVAWEVENRQIEADDLPNEMRGPRDLVLSTGGLVGLTMEQVEHMLIERTLQATGGNREHAAKMLGIGTRTLYRKIKEYEL